MNKKLKGNCFIDFNFKILIFVCILISLPTKILALENKILFKINNNIITTVDVLNEIKYLKLLNKNFKNLEQDKIYKIAKNSAIKDMIKENHLKKFFKEIELDEVFVEKFILDYFSRYNFSSIEDLEKFLIENNLKLSFIEKKITLQLMWNELILKKFSQNIKINKNKIEKQIVEKKFQQELLISEIVVNKKNKYELQNKYNENRKEIKNKSIYNAAINKSKYYT